MSTLKDDIAMYSRSKELRHKLASTPLKDGETAYIHGGKVITEKNNEHTHPSHSIRVIRVTNQMVYKPNGGNAGGVYPSHLRTLYFTEHFPSKEVQPVPTIPEPVPSHFVAAYSTPIWQGVTLGDWLEEMAYTIQARVNYDKEVRKARRKRQ